MKISMTPIGVVHTPFAGRDDVPRQGAQSETEGTVEVFPEYEEGLKDIDTFTHIILLFYFDRSGVVRLVGRTPYDDTPRGVFACRSPYRPNGLGMTVVRLMERRGNVLAVRGVDMLDGTPILDIKPYMPGLDCHPDAGRGWVEETPEQE